MPKSVRTATVSGPYLVRKRRKNGILAAVKRSQFGRQRSVLIRLTAYSISDRKLSVPLPSQIGPFSSAARLKYDQLLFRCIR